MPSFAQSNGSATGTTARFQLPALDLKFGSLTEGTDIPPPLPSPIQEEPPLAQHDASKPTAVTAVTTVTTATQTSPDALKNGNGFKRSADAMPASPTSTKGPASLRRLFSRNRLNEAYLANPDPHVGEAMSPRPPSQSNASVSTNKQSKRSSGWFRRLRGSDSNPSENRRGSRVFFAAPESPKPAATMPVVEKPTGPPAPKIPEFNALGSKVDLSGDAGSLGADLFKDIK